MTDSPKRSKGSAAKSLLHRVTSRHDVHKHSPDGPAHNLEPKLSNSNLSVVSTAAGSSPSFSASRRPPAKHGAQSEHDSDAPEAQDSALPDPEATDAIPAVPTGASIEQSVKLFKIFEALRNGDWETLSTIMQIDKQAGTSGGLEGTTVLHLAVQIAELSMVENVLKLSKERELNAVDKEGNTPLHIAAQLGRTQVVRVLLEQPAISESISNYHGKTPLDVARNPEVFQQLQLARSLYVENNLKILHGYVQQQKYDDLESFLSNDRIRSILDVNGTELATDTSTVESGGSLLHEAARRRDTKLIQLLLLNGADPFRRDRRGKLPQDVTKDDRTKAILKKSPAAAAAQRGIQEKAILGAQNSTPSGGPSDVAVGSKEAREMKGYLKKWTNYTSGFKLRWFVLEDGVLSYYKNQDDAGSACRGAINMRIARLSMDPKEKTAFEIAGKSSVKYSLKANHQVEAKRWFWALNNAIQYAKDEVRDEQRKHKQSSDALRQKSDPSSTLGVNDGQVHHSGSTADLHHLGSSRSGAPSVADEDQRSTYAHSAFGDELHHSASRNGTQVDMDDDYDGDDASSQEARPANRDAFNITAQSARLQLDLLAQVSTALQNTRDQTPNLPLSDPSVENALVSYDTAVRNLRGLVIDLLRISKDHEAYWQYRLDREINVRRLWEESMTRVAKEQEELQGKIGESEDKRRKTKRALREALEAQATASTDTRTKAVTSATADPNELREAVGSIALNDEGRAVGDPSVRKRLTLADYTNNEISDDESEIDDEFFDAVDAGDVEVVEELPPSAVLPQVDDAMADKHAAKNNEIAKSYVGYEDGIRKKLKLDADNRPKVSLWGVLKSMIGKDMTKMTLPVTFNEPTSLLYRVVEDLEFTDLLNQAAERVDPTERMVYVAAFAASEYASTIGRVAKPFNPLLGETYEYVRPDKGYRFFIEQVSHHPPVGAGYTESAKWDYYGESAVKSKFYGKSFEFNPLGTWFLHLRPDSGTPKEELYTWKKVTSSVVGIITGNPQVDNYGPMEIKNHTTGESCILDFKPRGWKASSAFIVTGRVLDADGNVRWSIGGRWNDKIYARSTPGYEGAVEPPTSAAAGGSLVSPTSAVRADQAFLVWEASPRPSGIPFNLTPFAVTLNDIPDRLRPFIAPTDTRLRPDQRAMEDGEYDFAASEKTRLEESQRARRRQRETAGDEFVPRWFTHEKHPTTGEPYWKFNHNYWKVRNAVANGERTWEDEGLEPIY